MYEEILNLNYIQKIFPNCSNINEGFQNLIKIFENKKVEIKDIIIDKHILLNLIINREENFELKLFKVNKSENDIIKELIEKYCSLEKKYDEMKKSFDNLLLKYRIPRQTVNNYNYNYNYNNNYVNTFNTNFNYNNYNNSSGQEIEEKDDENHISLGGNFSIWCMIKLNPINYIKDNQNLTLNLVGIGTSDPKIVLVNISTMKLHQTIQTASTVYSLSQFYNNSKYLFCSLSTGFILVYKLKENNEYEEIQKLQKPVRRGEINKVITLSSGDLAGADRKSVSIWKQKKDEKNNLIDKFEYYKEILTDYDTCHLVEVNPNVFACAMHSPKMIKIFNNNGIDYPLLGTINNVESHGNNSNGMAKINDQLFCSGGTNHFMYIVCVEPIQLIQTIKVFNGSIYDNLSFIHVTSNGFLFTSYENYIIIYKIVTDEDNNFIELKLINTIDNQYYGSKAIITTDEGKIFYQVKGKQRFFLTSFKTS